MSDLLQHLAELKSRMIKTLLVLTFCFLIIYPFSNTLFAQFSRFALPNQALLASEVTSTFMVPLKFSILLCFIVALPFSLYQIAAFMWPGLYPHERKWLVGLLFTAILLFFTGATFALFLICPMALHFFSSTAPEGITVMTELSHFYEFMVDMVFAFGLSFELPVILFLAILKGWVSIDALKKARPYVIVLAFVVGMILTPPDVLSQVTLAVPLLLLFESTLFVSRFFKLNQNRVKSLQING